MDTVAEMYAVCSVLWPDVEQWKKYILLCSSGVVYKSKEYIWIMKEQ